MAGVLPSDEEVHVGIYDRLKAYRESVGAPWFDAPWDLNLCVIRSGTVGVWDDRVVICTTDEAGRRVVQRVVATGDAWEGEWLEPSHPDGCVYVLDQHVPGGLILGEHKGRPALRQQKPFRCVRWPAGEAVPTVAQLEDRALTRAVSDIRGTHLHNRVSGMAPEKPAANDSEGCTVSLYYHQHAAMIELVRQQERVHGSTVVSPTFLKRSALP